MDVAFAAMDDTSNMDKLTEIGEKLLERPVYRTDWETRRYQPVEGAGTNKEALTELAERLSAERRRRMAAASREDVTDITTVTEPRRKKYKPNYK